MSEAVIGDRWTLYDGAPGQLQVDYLDAAGAPKSMAAVTEVEALISAQRGAEAVVALYLSEAEIVQNGDGWLIPPSGAHTAGLGATGGPVGEAGRGETGSYWMQVWVTDAGVRDVHVEGPVSVLPSNYPPAA